MAVSGSQDFRLNRTQVLDTALKDLGVLRSGDTITNDSTLETDCALKLNMMLKSWQNLGIQLWVREEQTIALTKGQNTYSWEVDGDINAATPLRVVSAFHRNMTSNVDVDLTLMTKNEYDNLSNKDTTGTPTQFYFDYQDTTGSFKTWPAPNSNTYNAIATFHKAYDDMDSASDNLDFPQSWMETVVLNLQIRLAPMFGKVLPQETIQLAAITLQNAMEASYEEGSVRFIPSFHRR